MPRPVPDRPAARRSLPALAVKAAPAFLGAAAELLHVVLIVAGVIVGVGAAGLLDLLIWRGPHPAGRGPRQAPLQGALYPLHGVTRAAQPLPKSQPALERPSDIHLHPHGVSAEDIAALLARHEDGPAWDQARGKPGPRSSGIDRTLRSPAQQHRAFTWPLPASPAVFHS